MYHVLLSRPSQLFAHARIGAAIVAFLTGYAQAQTNDLSGRTPESIRNVISLVARHQMNAFGALSDGDYTPVATLQAARNAVKPSGLGWNYPWGVTLYGILHASEAAGEKEALNYVLNHNLILGRYFKWAQSLSITVTNATPAQILTFQRSLPTIGVLFDLTKLDDCGAMGSQFMEGILNHSGGAATGQGQVGYAIASYIATNYPGAHQARLADGTLWRPASDGGSIWDDDLYMSCPFLIRWARFTNDDRMLDEAAQQVINMAGYNQSASGIWFHGYIWGSNKGLTHTNAPVKWGRANGWAMVTTVEILSVMPTNHPARPRLLDILRRHIEGIKQVQAPSGMWYQVLDDATNPSNWEETSCSAMFAYSIARAVNRGWIDSTNMLAARKAFAAICRNVTGSGIVNGTCAGTGIGYNEAFYFGRPRPSDDLHGRGVVMLAGAEILLGSKRE